MKCSIRSTACTTCFFACLIAGCSSWHAGKSVSLSVEELRAHPRLAAFLQAQGTLPRNSTSAITIYNDDQTASKLSGYLDGLRLEYATINANIANAETIADEFMKNRPYRRRFVEMRSNGTFEILVDSSPLPRQYIPTHPLADKAGFVLLTNVDTAYERLDLRRVSDDYEMVRAMLMRIDPNQATRTIKDSA
jgi:flagellar basal body rod protein FlgC